MELVLQTAIAIKRLDWRLIELNFVVIARAWVLAVLAIVAIDTSHYC